MNIVDSHCHLDTLDLAPYGGDLQRVLDAAKALGVHHFLCVCIDLDHFPTVLAVAEKYQQVFATVGLHPNEVVDSEPTIEQLVQLAKHPKVVGIGETGLDYYRTEEASDWQQQRFRTHIQAAKLSGKPLIIHSRAAKADTIRLMKEENAADVGGVMHCFTEDWEMAKQAMDLGFYISFSGIVTFRNAEILKEVAQRIPLDKMLVETDAPYLAPIPYRGKPNEPAYVRHVVEYIATLRGISAETVAEQTTKNFFNLFTHAHTTD